MSKKDKLIECINKCINSKKSIEITYEHNDSVDKIEMSGEELNCLKISIEYDYLDDLTQGKNRITKYRIV